MLPTIVNEMGDAMLMSEKASKSARILADKIENEKLQAAKGEAEESRAEEKEACRHEHVVAVEAEVAEEAVDKELRAPYRLWLHQQWCQ